MTVESAGQTSYEPFEPFAAWAGIRVGGAWVETLAALRDFQDDATQIDLDATIEYALRAAAMESGAIEGLYSTSRGVTRTVALQGAMWEAELAKLGSDVRGHFEAQLAAFELVLDAATNQFPMTEAWLRDLHATACAGQETYKVWTDSGWQDRQLQHGAYKTEPNNVGLADGTTHWYAPWADVPAEMHRLMTEMGSAEFATAHTVLQAAYAHHALTAIHPFADGNGRVARALASVFLYRAAGVPLVIFSDQQEPYWDALAEADKGRPVSFVRFIDDRAIDTMGMVADRLREVRSPLESRAAALRAILTAHGGLTHAEVNSVGHRLSQQLRSLLEAQFSELNGQLGRNVHGQVFSDNYRPIGNVSGQPYHALTHFLFMVRSYYPSEISADMRVVVAAANDTTEHFAFLIADVEHADLQPLKLRVSDLHPAMTAASQERMDGWVKHALNNALVDLTDKVAASLVAQGYLPQA